MNIDRWLDVEWLETDGLGGFASGTAALAGSRCYHAMYNPAVRPPLGRMVLWASSAEILRVGRSLAPLHTLSRAGVLEGNGHTRLTQFTPHPWPTWTYTVAGGTLTRELFLVHGNGDAFLMYTWRGGLPAELVLYPQLAFRDHHHVSVGTEAEGLMEPWGPHGMIFRLRGPEPKLHVHAEDAEFLPDPTWVRDIRLAREAYRGLPYTEDRWSPGAFHIPLEPNATRAIRVSLDKDSPFSPVDAAARERQRREQLTLPRLAPYGLSPLGKAADQFLIRRGEKSTVIAGYPWFTDWGRDTMIALPGLTLAANRPAVARELLETFAAHLVDGLIPNRFPDEGEHPEYNTVDATLWMAVALLHTWNATGDRELVEILLPVLREVRAAHQRGTRHGIRVADDGLLRAGEEGVQLTWMDAKVDDWVVTPRIGKPVEIQALWYNFLKIGGALSDVCGEDASDWEAAAARVHAAFQPAFWSARHGYLADVLRDDGTLDWSLRPNQLFALSLPYPLVDAPAAQAVLQRVRKHLVTPRGLRSLAPDDPHYQPIYGGDRPTRDAAYHQGTVWGWLHGPYMEACLRYRGSAGKSEVVELLRGWADHLEEGCLGQAAEVFDGEAPHPPRGCPAQAWTVAELIRVAALLEGNIQPAN